MNEPSRVLVLRTCSADMTSYGGFQYPESGWVEAPDWDGGKDACGGGLHGFLWGCGEGGLAGWSASARWLVLSVDPSELVEVTADGGGKCKFRGGEIVFVGDRKGATDYLQSHGAADKPIIGCFKTGGNNSTVTGGNNSTVTGGNNSTVTGGNRSTVTGGDNSTVTGGDGSTVTGGYGSTVTGGYSSTVTGGYRSTVTGGYSSTVTGGYRSTLVFRYWDHEANRNRLIVAYVGEGGIEPGVAYRFNGASKTVKAVEGGAR